MSLRSADVEVWVLDDGHRPEMEWAARRLGARYVSRPTNEGAKAGNINYAFERTTAPFIAVFDCDHVPYPRFLEMTLGHFNTPTVGYVQTPQYYSTPARTPPGERRGRSRRCSSDRSVRARTRATRTSAAAPTS